MTRRCPACLTVVPTFKDDHWVERFRRHNSAPYERCLNSAKPVSSLPALPPSQRPDLGCDLQ